MTDLADGRILPAVIEPCPRCGDRDAVQYVVYGFPPVPHPDEEHRLRLEGCRGPGPDDPTWWCPACGRGYG